MDNKAKYLYVAIAILLAYVGYLRYNVYQEHLRLESIPSVEDEDDGSGAEIVITNYNVPIGRYEPNDNDLPYPLSGGSSSKRPIKIYKLYLRRDGKVEINDRVTGEWQEHKGDYTISILPNLGGRQKDLLYVKITDTGLDISGHRSRDGAGPSDDSHYAEKDFIYFKWRR